MSVSLPTLTLALTLSLQVSTYHMPCLFGSDEKVQVMTNHAALAAQEALRSAGLTLTPTLTLTLALTLSLTVTLTLSRPRCSSRSTSCSWRCSTRT